MQIKNRKKWVINKGDIRGINGAQVGAASIFHLKFCGSRFSCQCAVIQNCFCQTFSRLFHSPFFDWFVRAAAVANDFYICFFFRI